MQHARPGPQGALDDRLGPARFQSSIEVGRRRLGRLGFRCLLVAAAAAILVFATPTIASATTSPAPTTVGAALTHTWAPTGPMSVARSGQTATLLPNGKVLVVGGAGAGADLFDPVAGTFTPTGSMSVARPGATATLLPNGLVLVAGGCCANSTTNLSTAELYDPSTGHWSLTGSMVHPRSGQTAVLLSDGKVLVAGGACNGSGYGCDSGSSLVNQRSAELYDPSAGTWAATGSMLDGREFATASLLRSGEVLVAGGFNNCDDSFCTDLAESELYNPNTGQWQKTGTLQGPREQHSATLLENGMVLVAGGLNEGGFGNGGIYSSAELYNPATGSWTPTASMAGRHYGQTATLLKSGWVLVAGGESADAQVFEPTRGVWVPTGAMTTVRTGATATRLPDGHVLVAGGTGPNGQPQPTAELFIAGTGPLVGITPSSLSFGAEQAGSTGSPQAYTVTNLGSAPLIVSGVAISGPDPSDFLASNDCTGAPLIPSATCTVTIRFSPTGTGLRQAVVAVGDNAPLTPQGAAVDGYGAGPNTFAPTGSLAIGRDGQTSTLLDNGQVLIAGGEQGPSANPLADAEIYDAATGVFTVTGSLNTGRAFATATLLPDGDVLVAGGKGANSANLASAERYHPATGKWSVTGSMNTFGYDGTATLLPNGKVLVAGLGFGASAEVYDPASGAWTDTGPTPVSAFFGTATLLTDGQVLATGGSSTGATALYNPSTNTWATTGSLHVPRMAQTATELPDGKVLVAGGDPPGGGAPLSSAELYDPATGTWTSTGSMTIGRYGHTATLLPNGVVMVAGGCTGTCGPVVASTEFYSGGYWTYGPSMTTPRYNQTATLLADGDLLVAGGGAVYCCADTATAEVYQPTLLDVSPASGPPGQPVTVSGSGFFAGELVQVTFDFSTRIGQVTTSAAGTFTVHTKIPAAASAGAHTLQASGSRSFAGARTTFAVT